MTLSDELRAGHYSRGSSDGIDRCMKCIVPPPCPSIRAADRIDQLEEARCPRCGEWVRDFPLALSTTQPVAEQEGT